MVLGFPRADRIALREAQADQDRELRERELRLVAQMRRAADRRDTLADLRSSSRSHAIPDEVA